MNRSRARTNAGVALIDCLVYISLLALILGLSFGAFIESVNHSTELERISTTTVRVLQAGEQWRRDVRQATARPVVRRADDQIEMHIPTPQGQIGYLFRESTVLRRSGSEAPWLEAVGEIRHTQFTEDARNQVTAWRWDVELKTRRDQDRFRRVFTFEAVPPLIARP